MENLLSQTYTWTKQWSKGRYGLLVIFIFLFLDASIFPLPTTIAFITVSLIHPSRSYNNALIAVTGMTMGAILGYAIGHYLWLMQDGSFTRFAQYLFDHVPGLTKINYQNAQVLFHKWSYGILLFSTILPIPYQFFSITAGAFDFDIFAFALSTFIFQGLRFFLLAWIIIRFGERVKAIFKQNLLIIIVVSVLLLFIFILTTKIGS